MRINSTTYRGVARKKRCASNYRRAERGEKILGPFNAELFFFRFSVIGRFKEELHVDRTYKQFMNVKLLILESSE